MKNPWQLLEGLISEAVIYRGDNGVRLQDIEKLFKFLTGDNPERKVYTQDPVASSPPNPKGGVVTCEAEANPSVWTKWSGQLDTALKIGASAGKKEDPYVGAPQGSTMVQKNWGARVSASPGKPRSDFERDPSAMDRYDVIMVGRTNSGKPAGPLNMIQNWGGDKKPLILTKVVWSPSIGSYDERRARLEALLGGKQGPALRRRPQGELPKLRAPKNDPNDRTAMAGKPKLAGTDTPDGTQRQASYQDHIIKAFGEDD